MVPSLESGVEREREQRAGEISPAWQGLRVSTMRIFCLAGDKRSAGEGWGRNKRKSGGGRATSIRVRTLPFVLFARGTRHIW